MRSYAVLSDHDFELLVADLFTAEEGNTFETFARGPDRGVDVRHIGSKGADVVQCKHMLGSTYSQLKSAARKEGNRLNTLSPAPCRYRFVTTQGLSPKRKTELKDLLQPWIRSDSDVLGAEDLEGLLNRHEQVERAHIKLWLGSAAQLDERLHAGTWARSNQLHAEIRENLPRYVENIAFADARRRLRSERVLVVSGPPGIGKTTMARMLVADATPDGYEPIEVSSDIEEAFDVVNDHDARIFYYDDFLGSTFLQDRLAKNEDKRLSSFMRRCTGSRKNLLVLTTREHILQQAASWYEELERSGLPLRRFLLELSAYSRYDRARIFYNHIWFSQQLTTPARSALLAGEKYLSIIDHRNYNPRLIEYITGLASRALDEQVQADYVGFALGVLDNPDQIWERAFEQQLDEDSQPLLVVVATLGSETALKDVGEAFTALRAAQGRSSVPSRALRAALRVLDDSFLESWERSDETFVELANPSVADFVAAWLNKNHDQALAAIQGAQYFEQLIWLHQRLTTAGELTDVLHAALMDGVRRLYMSDTPGWHEVYVGRDAAEPSWRRQHRYLEDRLVFAYDIASDDAEMSKWFTAQLRKVADRWRRHIYDAGRPVSLIRRLQERGYALPAAIVEAARDGLRKSSYSYAWSQLARLRDACPEAFDSVTDKQIAAEYRAWATNMLMDPEDIDDEDELYTITRIADEFGAALDAELLANAEADLANRSRDGNDPDDSDPAAGGAPSLDPAAESAAIAALFAHLSE